MKTINLKKEIKNGLMQLNSKQILIKRLLINYKKSQKNIKQKNKILKKKQKTWNRKQMVQN